MDGSRTIFFAGGGTGGHLYPGIAVAQAVRELAPDITPIFLTTTREIDRTILAPTGFEAIAQPIVPPVKTIAGLMKFWKSWRETKDLVRAKIRERRPAVVLGLGGYAAGVAVKVGALREIPTAILNPDVIPGKANHYLMRYAQAVCCQFDETREHVASQYKPKLRTTGCPIRRELLSWPTKEAAAGRLELEGRLNTLVVTGASQGAVTVNEAVIETLGKIRLQGWQVLHLAGKDHGAKVRDGYRELAARGVTFPVRVIDFTPAMADVWAVADLVVSRSGASSVAEICQRGVASILMPYPYHKDLHQRANAKVLAERGAAMLLDDEKDKAKNAAKLGPALEGLLYDADRRALMGEMARGLAKGDAAKAVAELLVGIVGAKAEG